MKLSSHKQSKLQELALELAKDLKKAVFYCRVRIYLAN